VQSFTVWRAPTRPSSNYTGVTSLGCAASTRRSGNGSDSTRWRTGTRRMTWSTSGTAVWAIRRARHNGQKPRRLQLKATSLSWPQSSQHWRLKTGQVRWVDWTRRRQAKAAKRASWFSATATRLAQASTQALRSASAPTTSSRPGRSAAEELESALAHLPHCASPIAAAVGEVDATHPGGRGRSRVWDSQPHKADGLAHCQVRRRCGLMSTPRY